MYRSAYFYSLATVSVVVIVWLCHALQQWLWSRAQKTLNNSRHASAHGLADAGSFLGSVMLATSVSFFSPARESLLHDAFWTSVFAIISILLFQLSARLGARTLLPKHARAEVLAGNRAAAIVMGTHFAATGILVSRCMYGNEFRELPLSIVFFVLSQLILHLFLVTFRWLTPYSDAEEIADGNEAAALSYGGFTLALAWIIGHAVEGEFGGWIDSLLGFAMALAPVALLYPTRQLVVQTLLLRGKFSLRRGVLDQRIVQQRDTIAGAMEAVSYLATAFVATRLGE